MRKHRRFTRMFGALALSLALATTSIPALDINSNQVYGTEKVETRTDPDNGKGTGYI